MLPTQGTLPLSSYSDLYDIVVPQSHFLRKLNALCGNFDFIYDELKSKYCPYNGRMAEDPRGLFKLLLLKVIDDLSDIDVVERSRYDISYKWFLWLSPEDGVIVGHKTKDSSFFGYKTYIAISQEGIVTAAVVTSAAAADGGQMQALIDKSAGNGVEVEAVIGDGAYCGSQNLDDAGGEGVAVVSKLNANVLGCIRQVHLQQGRGDVRVPRGAYGREKVGEPGQENGNIPLRRPQMRLLQDEEGMLQVQPDEQDLFGVPPR